ncbi:MAG: SHOCT domain-containing protein [Lawsonibacter sp.]|nr:SHOCT domain-containing protein [Lawsonibacter sp.]
MGSMVMSTVMMFIPRHVVFLFLAICCIGFFGIYVPYNESKKKGEAWRPLRWLTKKKLVRKKPRREFDRVSAGKPGSQRQLEQLETMKKAGLITDREYQQKKNDIFGEL